MKTSKFNKGLTVAVFAVLFIMFAGVIFANSGENEWKAPVLTKKIKNPLAKIVAASKKGKILFETNCAVCHGAKGKGDGMAAASLNPKPADLSSDRITNEADGELFWKISNGRGNMPPWKAAFTTTQRWQIVNYIRTFKVEKK